MKNNSWGKAWLRRPPERQQLPYSLRGGCGDAIHDVPRLATESSGREWKRNPPGVECGDGLRFAPPILRVTSAAACRSVSSEACAPCAPAHRRTRSHYTRSLLQQLSPGFALGSGQTSRQPYLHRYDFASRFLGEPLYFTAGEFDQYRTTGQPADEGF